MRLRLASPCVALGLLLACAPARAATGPVCVGREGGAQLGPGDRESQPAPGLARLLLALSLLQLADRGVLDLEDPVSSWVPGLPKSPFPRPMRVRHLVEGTSGLRGPARGDLPLDRALVRHGPLRTEPGRRAVPSAMADRVLAAVIEAATGQGARRHVRSNVLDPLDLGATELAAEPWELARASTGDLLRLGQALLREGELDGLEILSPEATRTFVGPLRSLGPWGEGLAGLTWKLKSSGPALRLRTRRGAARMTWVLEPARGRVCVSRS